MQQKKISAKDRYEEFSIVFLWLFVVDKFEGIKRDKLISRAFPAHQAKPVVSWSRPAKAKL
jgi:hypothetical protein